MVAMLSYTIYSLKNRGMPHCNKYGPLYFVAASVPLVMADLTRHVILDHVHVWWLLEYRAMCGSETVKCLTTAGIVFTIVCTYLGFICLFIGSLWNANICEKIRELREKWRQLRADVNDDSAPGALQAVSNGVPVGTDASSPDAPFDPDTFVATADPYAPPATTGTAPTAPTAPGTGADLARPTAEEA